MRNISRMRTLISLGIACALTPVFRGVARAANQSKTDTEPTIQVAESRTTQMPDNWNRPCCCLSCQIEMPLEGDGVAPTCQCGCKPPDNLGPMPDVMPTEPQPDPAPPVAPDWPTPDEPQPWDPGCGPQDPWLPYPCPMPKDPYWLTRWPWCEGGGIQ